MTAFSNYGLCVVLHVLSVGVNDYNKNKILNFCKNYENIENDSCFSNELKIESDLSILDYVRAASNFVKFPITYNHTIPNDGKVSIFSNIKFSCNWLYEFKTIGKMKFDEKNLVEMMSIDNKFNVYFENGSISVVVPFENENYKLILFLPSKQKTYINPVQVYNTLNGEDKIDVTLMMPKFFMKDHTDCTGIVKSLIPTLFNGCVLLHSLCYSYFEI